MDRQTAVDDWFDKAHGAMTYYFLQTLKSYRIPPTCYQVYRDLNTYLRKGFYQQRSQFSSGKRLDLYSTLFPI
jgi:hypothetical protein